MSTELDDIINWLQQSQANAQAAANNSFHIEHHVNEAVAHAFNASVNYVINKRNEENSKVDMKQKTIDELHYKLSQNEKAKSDLVVTKSDLAKAKSDLVMARSDLAKEKSALVMAKSDLAKEKSALVMAKSDLAKAESALAKADLEIVSLKTKPGANAIYLLEEEDDTDTDLNPLILSPQAKPSKNMWIFKKE